MQKISSEDVRFMRRALEVAEKGRGRVHPNPMVGAVVVKNGKILSEGAHEFFGGPHAEVNALRGRGASASGATLYLTLEPCAHFGKTPPCADLLISQKISRAVIAAKDPNPLVNGKGIRRLKKAGLPVTLGVLEKESENLNRDFRHWIAKKRPYVSVKVAQTLDGKIATSSGESRWITGKEAREFSHRLRAAADAVLVGVNTLLKDNPRLDARIPGVKRQPVKVVLDATLKTPLSSKIFKTDSPVILFATRRAAPGRVNELRKKAEVLIVPEKKDGWTDIPSVLKELGKKGIVNLLVEGGGEVIASFLGARAVNECYVFVAPKIIGGRGSVNAVAGEGVGKLSKAWTFRHSEWRMVGKDLLLHGTF